MVAWLLSGCVFLVLYPYLIYPALLVLAESLQRLRRRWVEVGRSVEASCENVAASLPSVSVLIAAHNEAGCIAEKLHNTLALDYPPALLEVWVGSDGSTDDTEQIVRAVAAVHPQRRIFVSAAPRAGKAAVLNRLAELARGRMLLLTDANTRVDSQALRRLVAAVRGPSVAGACGRLLLRPAPGGAAEESGYWRLENLLKWYESRLGASAGLNGGLYLLRSHCWLPLPPGVVVDDLVVALLQLARGRQLPFVVDAVGEEDAVDGAGERRRRVRIAAGNWQSAGLLWRVVRRGGLQAWVLASHKLARWLAPVPMVVGGAAALWLIARTGPVMAASVVGLATALVLHPPRRPRLLSRWIGLARSFVVMNLALAQGALRALRGTQQATWQRTERLPARAAEAMPTHLARQEGVMAATTGPGEQLPLHPRRGPRTAIERGPVEEPVQLEPLGQEHWWEGGGDTAAEECDANVGGASATAGLDSGGAVGVRLGRAVGRPGYEYADAAGAEVGPDLLLPRELSLEESPSPEELLRREQERWLSEGGA